MKVEIIMQTVVIYQIINRELSNPQHVEIPDDVRDYDKWLHDNGYDRTHTIRRGIVQPITRADIAALGKPSAPLPGYRPNFNALKGK